MYTHKKEHKQRTILQQPPKPPSPVEKRISVHLSWQAVYIKSHSFHLGNAGKCCNQLHLSGTGVYLFFFLLLFVFFSCPHLAIFITQFPNPIQMLRFGPKHGVMIEADLSLCYGASASSLMNRHAQEACSWLLYEMRVFLCGSWRSQWLPSAGMLRETQAGRVKETGQQKRGK